MNCVSDLLLRDKQIKTKKCYNLSPFEDVIELQDYILVPYLKTISFSREIPQICDSYSKLLQNFDKYSNAMKSFFVTYPHIKN